MAKKTRRKKKVGGRKVTKRAGARASAPAARTARAGGEGGGGLSGLSIDALQAEIQRRQRNLTALERRRERLLEQLSEVETEIRGSGGSLSGRTVRKRPKNAMNLVEALQGVLKGTEMSVTEVADAVQQAGYQTTAANFRTIVNQTLIKHPQFKKISRGVYTAK